METEYDMRSAPVLFCHLWKFANPLEFFDDILYLDIRNKQRNIKFSFGRRWFFSCPVSGGGLCSPALESLSSFCQPTYGQTVGYYICICMSVIYCIFCSAENVFSGFEKICCFSCFRLFNFANTY